jgi:hypothetical protein
MYCYSLSSFSQEGKLGFILRTNQMLLFHVKSTQNSHNERALNGRSNQNIAFKWDVPFTNLTLIWFAMQNSITVKQSKWLNCVARLVHCKCYCPYHCTLEIRFDLLIMLYNSINSVKDSVQKNIQTQTAFACRF